MSVRRDLERHRNEAPIGASRSSAVHANARNLADTDWRHIVALYDTLMRMRPSPVVALNRAIAIGQLEGPEPGLDAIHAIARLDRLDSYPFYFAAIGELELRLERRDSARQQFQAALSRARSPMERRFFEQRISACDSSQ